jgi:hypothetical protein
MILAIEADGAGYRDSGSVRDRDRLRKEHLERLGWRVHRLWSTAWFTDPEGELAKLRKAFDSAVRAAPPPPASEPETEPPEPPTPQPEAEPEPPSPAPSSPPETRSPEPGPSDAGSWQQDEESWPPTDDPARAIPLGPGERQRLSGPGARALPASGGPAGPAALPAAREPRNM